jgi:hypothetical protein
VPGHQALFFCCAVLPDLLNDSPALNNIWARP